MRNMIIFEIIITSININRKIASNKEDLPYLFSIADEHVVVATFALLATIPCFV
jgi:hypothetical protein